MVEHFVLSLRKTMLFNVVSVVVSFFLVPFGQKLNKFVSNSTNRFVKLLASLRELKVCINLEYLTSLRATCAELFPEMPPALH